jgi:hypothetical protein
VLFSVEAARKGPTWAKTHLGRVAVVMGLVLVVALFLSVLLRPVWLGLGAAYPVAIGAFLAWGRWRQLVYIEREIGFGEIDPLMRERVLARLRRGLAVLGLIALVAGIGLVATGLPHGWILTALVPVAAFALARARMVELEAHQGNQLSGPSSL